MKSYCCNAFPASEVLRHCRGLVQSGVKALEPPKFVKVPIVDEPQSRLMEDMPDLVLGGHAPNYDKQSPCVGAENLCRT